MSRKLGRRSPKLIRDIKRQKTLTGMGVGSGGGLEHNEVTLDSTVTNLFDLTGQRFDIDAAAANGDLIYVNAGNYDLINAGNQYDVLQIDGTGYPSWAPIFDATVPTTIQPDDAAVAGSANIAARRDHQHAIAAGAPGSPSVDLATSAEGSGASFARGDHTHQLDQSIVPSWSAIHTHQANVVFDDGSGNSPVLQFVGGSNDDTVSLWVEDHASAGYSDLAIKLAGNTSEAQLILYDTDDFPNVVFTATGYGYFADSVGITAGKYVGIASDTRLAFASGSVTVTAGDLIVGPDYKLTIQYDVSNYADLDVDVSGNLILNATSNIVRFAYDGSYYADFEVDSGGDLTINPVGHNLILAYDGGNYADFLIGSGGSLTVAPTNDLILNPGGVDVLPGSTVAIDLGDYDQMWRTVYTAELYAPTIVAEDVMSTVGGRLIVAPTTKLTTALTAIATTIYVEHNHLASGDYVLLQSSPGGTPQTEVLEITGAPGGSGPYSYTVNRDEDGSGANTWEVGDAVVNLGGAAGEGWIDLTSTSTVLSHDGPTATIYARTATTNWNDVSPVVTMGNLDSFLGYGVEYGFAAADDLLVDPSGGTISAVSLDRTNGLRLWNSKISLFATGVETVTLDPATPSIAVGAASSTMDYTTNTGFWVGNDSGTYKARIGNPSGQHMAFDGSDIYLYMTTTEYVKITGTTLEFVSDSDTMLYMDSTPELVIGNGLTDENYLIFNATGMYIYNSTDDTNIGSWVGHQVVIGSTDEAHVIIDDTDGIQFYDSTATPVQRGEIQPDGDFWFGAGASSSRLQFTQSTTTLSLYQGSTEVMKFPASGNAEIIGTLDVSSPGVITAGGGGVWLDSAGLNLEPDTGGYAGAIHWQDVTYETAQIDNTLGTGTTLLTMSAQTSPTYSAATTKIFGNNHYGGNAWVSVYLNVEFGVSASTVGWWTSDGLCIGDQSARYFHYDSSRVKFYDGGEVAEFTTYGMYLPKSGQTYNQYLYGSMKVAHGESGHIDFGATTARVQSTTPYLNFTSNTVSEGGRICNAFAGNWTSGSYAHFCHWNYYNSGTGYGFMQSSTGLLYLSTASNQYGYLRVGNTTIAQWDNSGFRIEQNYEYMAHRYNSSGTSTWYTTYTFVPLTSADTVWAGITRSSTGSATIIYWNNYGVPRDAVAVAVSLDVVSSTAGDRLCFTPQNNITTAAMQSRVQVAGRYSPMSGIVPTTSHGSGSCYSYWWTGGTGITAYCYVWGYFM